MAERVSRERELLQKVVNHMWQGELVDEIKELLAQPEQEPLTPRQGLEEYKRGYARGFDVAREDYKQKVINAFGVVDE